MSYKIQTALPALKGFDADSKITASKAMEFFEKGYRFCVRYLSRLENESATDLTSEEVAAILSSGLALSAVQHVQMPVWSPSASLGKTYGIDAVDHAKAVGLIPGMNIWLDLEGMANTASETDVIAYCQNWYDIVFHNGFIPGLYVGARDILNSETLYTALSFQHYWKSLSHVPKVYKRGFQMIQQETKVVGGIGIDEDVTQLDELGGSVIWMVKD